MSINLKNRNVIRGLGITSIVGCLSIGLADGIGILLREHYNPLFQSVSNLALGPTGWVQDVGMYLGGIGIMTCAVGLYLELNSNWEVRLGELFLLTVGLGIVLAAIFKSGLPGKEEQIAWQIHGLSSVVAALSFLPVCFLVSPALRDNKKLFAYTIAAGILAVVLELGRGRLPSDWMYFGLHERLIGGNAFVWVSVTAWLVLVRPDEYVSA